MNAGVNDIISENKLAIITPTTYNSYDNLEKLHVHQTTTSLLSFLLLCQCSHTATAEES
jgi:hypothetical protein